MIWLILGYVYLMIHRPMEIWPALEPLRIELLYFSLLCAAWTVASKRLTFDLPQLAIALFGATVYMAWLLSPWSVNGEIQVKNFTLVLVFALVLATSLRDEMSVHRVVVVFLGVLALYMLHSVMEYRNGRHVYRMGISRLVGVDSTLGDPNSFGATIVYSLPFVRYLWVVWGPGWRRHLLAGYTCLAVGCIGLTGSRSSLLGLVAWVFLTLLLAGKKRVMVLVGVVMLAMVGFMLLPDELKLRFTTIIDPSVGPANARESGMGRLQGFLTGFTLWARFPLTGVGPGGWRPATGSKIESHNLFGQLIGELGTFGLIAFSMVLLAIGLGIRRLLRDIRTHEAEPTAEPIYHLAQAIAASTLLLLLLGIFGHNLYRYNYVWYAAFVSVLCRSYRQRVADREYASAEGWAAAWT